MFLKVEDVNCINLHWINGLLKCIHAVSNLRAVGAEIAYCIDVLVVRTVDFLKLYLTDFVS